MSRSISTLTVVCFSAAVSMVQDAFNNENDIFLSNGLKARVNVVYTGSPLQPALKPAIRSPNTISWVTLQESTQSSTLVEDKASSCP